MPNRRGFCYKPTMTEPEPLQQVDRTCVRQGRRKLTYFSGCDYFRLASHPVVLRAAHDGLNKFGLNVSASRMTTGNHDIYPTLETALADFFDAENALLLSSGYLTSLVTAQAVAGEFSHTFIDAHAHAALLDAATWLGCPVVKFKHRDPSDLAKSLARFGSGIRPIVLTDGMFSHDGSIAPLKAYLKLLPADGLILVDDAHGAGVLGETGRGSLEAEGVSRKRVVQCITLSKAFGAYGGAVVATRALRKKIFARSRLFMGSTPLPLPLACAALQAVKILHADKSLRRRLTQNTGYVKASLQTAGLNLPPAPGPIVPLHFEKPAAAAALKQRLLAAKIFPPFIQYPGGPANGYFRFVLSSEHTRVQLDQLLDVLTHA